MLFLLSLVFKYCSH